MRPLKIDHPEGLQRVAPLPHLLTRTGNARGVVADERGSASLEFITVGLLLLVPMVYLIVTLGLLQGAVLASEAAARHAARVFVTQPDTVLAQGKAEQAVLVILSDYGISTDTATVTVTCENSTNCLEPGTLVRVEVAVNVALPLVPDVLNLTQAANIPVSSSASEEVSRFAGVR